MEPDAAGLIDEWRKRHEQGLAQICHFCEYSDGCRLESAEYARCRAASERYHRYVSWLHRIQEQPWLT